MSLPLSDKDYLLLSDLTMKTPHGVAKLSHIYTCHVIAIKLYQKLNMFLFALFCVAIEYVSDKFRVAALLAAQLVNNAS